MKRRILSFTSVMILAATITLPVFCQAGDDKNKAKVLFDKAVALVEKEGLHKAFYEFNTNKKEFVDGPIHITVVSDEGVLFAHSYKPEAIGISIATSKSAGKRDDYSFQDALADMDRVGENVGEIHWIWWNPETNMREKKMAFVKRVHDSNPGFVAFFYVMSNYFAPLPAGE